MGGLPECYRCGRQPCECEDGITLYCADCRDVLPLLEKGSVDLVLTDPPYGVAYVTARRSRHDRLRCPVTNDESLDVLRAAWPNAMQCLKNDRHWYVFASPRMIHAVLPIVGNAKHTIAWDKGDRGTVGDLQCGFGEAWEAILYGMKGRRPLRGKRSRTVVRYDWSSTMDPVHPTVKPVPLLRQLVEWSTADTETVLDFNAGSGTTGRACKDLGRRCIMVEIEEKYCRIAAERLAQGVLFTLC